MKYSIIIPVFNEDRTISELLKRVKKVNYPGKREIIVINDGSTDQTQTTIEKIPGIKIINLKTNRGKGYALRQGFKKATGEIILLQDGDLEYDPKAHLKIIKRFRSSTDVVYGSRFIHKPKIRYPLFYFGNLFLSLLFKLLYGQKITDIETGQKAFSRKVLDKLSLTANGFDIETEITCKLAKKDIKIVEIPISYISRSYEEGKKIGMKDGIKALISIILNSVSSK